MKTKIMVALALLAGFISAGSLQADRWEQANRAAFWQSTQPLGQSGTPEQAADAGHGGNKAGATSGSAYEARDHFRSNWDAIAPMGQRGTPEQESHTPYSGRAAFEQSADYSVDARWNCIAPLGQRGSPEQESHNVGEC